MSKILIIILLTIGVNAKTIVGKILYALDEENVIPVIGLEVNGKEEYIVYSGKPTTDYIDKRKGQMLRVYLDKNGDVKKVEFVNSKQAKKMKQKSNLPFIGKKQTRNGSTKITISRNGDIKIYTHLKNGFKTHYNGKYKKGLISVPEDLHSWEVQKDKVCQGYRNAWECEKLY